MARWQRIGRLVSACAAALACLLPAGCLFPYAYPHFSHVPAVRLGEEAGQVHAFRVEAKGSVKDISQTIDEYTFSRVEMTGKSTIPLQADLSLDYGCYVAAVALNFPVHHGHSLSVRLYRRGCHPIELRSGEAADVKWQPAPDVVARENALDDALKQPELWSLPGYRVMNRLSVSSSRWDPNRLAPGSRAPEHREALLFFASEYEALAEETEVGAERLRGKARELRDRAAQ